MKALIAVAFFAVILTSCGYLDQAKIQHDEEIAEGLIANAIRPDMPASPGTPREKKTILSE